MTVARSEYAAAGVDPAAIGPFKDIMKEMGQRTLAFPNKRGVFVESLRHGASLEYRGAHRYKIVKTVEGLGNKSWIAEWMARFAGTGLTYYEGIGIDTALMAVNDCIAHYALPVMYLDEVAAGSSEWFENRPRALALAEGFFRVCEEVGMALPAGESPSLRYLIKAEPPVTGAPVLSGCVTGIVAPAGRMLTGERVAAGDHIIAVGSSGIHANGISLIISRALKLPDQFLTKIPETGRTLGEEALIPTRSYVALVEALLEADVDVHGFLPGTGDGVAKLLVDRRSFTYNIHRWVPVPPLMGFMGELGVSMEDRLTTFNYGAGYFVFVPPQEVEQTLAVGTKAGYELTDVGEVEHGERVVVFGPEDIVLHPKAD